jgi:type IV pilus assembly protein PilN
MPMINLLPWREELRQKRKKNFGLAMVGALLLAAAATLGTQYFYQQKIDYQDRRIERINQAIAEVDEAIREIETLDQEKRRLIERMGVVVQLEATTPEAVTLIDAFVDTLPDGTHLTLINQTGTTVRIAGVAQSNGRVSDFMRNIERADWIRSPRLEDIINEGSGLINDGRFNMFVTQVRFSDEEEAL